MKILYGVIAAVLAITITIFDGFFITNEGYTTVVKTMGQATKEVGPGFHFKKPFADSVVDLDARVRKAAESMQVSTSEQMPVDARVSVNWVLKPNKGMELYKEYGDTTKFEDNILEPMVRDVTKNSVAKFTTEEQLTKRDTVAELIKDNLIAKAQNLPIIILSVQVEELSLPKEYLASISNKQTQKNNAEAEKFVLEKQSLTARQLENTAQAEANSKLLIAKADAQAIELKGKADASAIEAKAKALGSNPLLIELTKAQNWNGSYVTTNIGSGTGVLMDVRDNKVK